MNASTKHSSSLLSERYFLRSEKINHASSHSFWVTLCVLSITCCLLFLSVHESFCPTCFLLLFPQPALPVLLFPAIVASDPEKPEKFSAHVHSLARFSNTHAASCGSRRGRF